ncbi:hypothetical protein [Motilibacter deserti]|uniref:DUF3040 domain-containing protein n=1 Tax=Motilibacter deserti TaxID=2714956 RepID=A0ABX0GZN2_9ACTN|nr:hypothetical protein [Motilibacter deserti]NHC15035.1 hypothetical protein [Motilibacter deserti]
MGLTERLGRWDDKRVVYRQGQPLREARLGSLMIWRAIGAGLAAALVGLLTLVVGRTAALLSALALVCAFLVAYVVWRRRRNGRMTGSSTTWPST